MEEAWPSISDAKRPLAPYQSTSVIATARLHFGFLDPSGKGSHPFGSFGLALDRPRTKLTLKRARAFTVSGPERERAEGYLRILAQSCGLAPTYALHIDDAIPPHAGLGSGTQLALAIGSALAALEAIQLSPQEIATRLGRGARSGIGIATFEAGGVVLDAGPGGGSLPTMVSRASFPAAWRVLLIFDPNAKGLAGPSEAAAFDMLPDFPKGESAELGRRITLGALPALVAGDFATFCQHIGYLQKCMGAYFAPLQGGPYMSPAVADALAWLQSLGITGLGQSSWGPTGFAFAASEADGQVLLAEARRRPEFAGLRFELAQGCNTGAKLRTD